MVFELLTGFLHQLHDVQHIIQWGGLAVICAIVFIETGLLVGFFLPGDSLLFTAGVFAAAGYLDLTSLLVLVTLCAIVGDQLGYAIGRKTGPLLFRREDSRFFKKAHLDRAKEFYMKHGSKAIVIARFMPIVRTFAPVVAGAAQMDYRRFTIYNIFGGALWVGGMVIAGYSLGALIPNIEAYLHYIIMGIVALSVLPIAIHYVRERRAASIKKSTLRFSARS